MRNINVRISNFNIKASEKEIFKSSQKFLHANDNFDELISFLFFFETPLDELVFWSIIDEPNAVSGFNVCSEYECGNGRLLVYRLVMSSDNLNSVPKLNLLVLMTL